MKHVVNFSGGACSFWAAQRVIQRYGTKDVVLLFADTLIEDDDLYTFNVQAAQFLGVPITTVCVGVSPWELFRMEGMIGNSRFPICSHKLKREPLDEWHKRNCLEMDTTVYVGMDWDELDRMEKLRAKKPNWKFEAPMQWDPIWDKNRMLAELTNIGIHLPKAYTQGFPHNNCGRRCIAAGITHMVHLLHVDPIAYNDWEQEEQITIWHLRTRDIEALTFLKDRRGGKSKSLSLYELRLRVESGEKFPKWEWGGCGCAIN